MTKEQKQVAEQIATMTAFAINLLVPVSRETPYARQATLEQVIQLLGAKV